MNWYSYLLILNIMIFASWANKGKTISKLLKEASFYFSYNWTKAMKEMILSTSKILGFHC